MPLPDPRLTKLAEMFASEKIVPAPVTFVDIAGIVKGASEGAGLGNKFLANIRECDAICQVVRVFADDDVVHVDGKVDPEVRHRGDRDRADPRRHADAWRRPSRGWRRKPATTRTASPSSMPPSPRRQILDSGTTLFAAGVGRGPVARAEPDDHQAVPLRVQRRRVGADRRRPQEPSYARWSRRPTRCSWTPRSSPNCIELDEESAAELLESIGQTERGLDALARAGFHTLKLQTYLTPGPRSRGRGPSIKATPRPRRPA